MPWPVADVERTDDPLFLEIRLEGLPVEGQTGPCDVTIAADSGGPSPDISAQVSSGGRIPADPTFAGCEVGARTTRVQLLATPGDRLSVRTSHPSHRLWVTGDDGRLRPCELPTCDPFTGQAPDTTGCQRELVDAVRQMDVPRRSSINVRGCVEGWAVVDVDIGASACPAGDEENRCAGKRIDRIYIRRQAGQWSAITYDNGPGCGTVRDTVPDFPAELCETLPPARPGP